MAQTTSQADTKQLQALVLAQSAARARLAAQAYALVAAAVNSFRGWYDSDQITAWAAKVAGAVEVLQKVQAQLTDSYLTRSVSMITGGVARPVGAIDVTGLRTDVTHAGAYARAADVFRYQQSRFDQFAKTLSAAELDDLGLPQGVAPYDLSTPLDSALERVRAVADADMQLADRAQSSATLAAQPDVTGYRRVIHPERSKGGTCGLCIAASDRIYHVEELRAIHDRCECTTLPIIGSIDPGSGLNNLDLNTLYKNAGGSTFANKLKGTRYQINEHGELGPVLSKEGDFRPPAKVKAATDKAPRKAKTELDRRNDLERILQSELGAQSRAHKLAESDPGQWSDYASKLDSRISDLQSQLAA